MKATPGPFVQEGDQIWVQASLVFRACSPSPWVLKTLRSWASLCRDWVKTEVPRCPPMGLRSEIAEGKDRQ